MLQVGVEALGRLLAPLGTAALVLLVVTVGAQLVTTKGGLSLAKLKPSLDRLNPISRLKELPGRNHLLHHPGRSDADDFRQRYLPRRRVQPRLVSHDCRWRLSA